MKKQYKTYHHFKGASLTPSEKVERKVVELLLNSKVPDSKRDSSIVFELKHSSDCIQIARILAQLRNLNMDIAEVAAALHDIHVIVKGTYKDHAKLGAPIARNILKETGGFSNTDIEIISEAVAHHSEKDIYTNEPFIELVKDVDVFACSMYKNARDEYKRIKSPILFQQYESRVKKVRSELGLPEDPVFRK